MQKSWAKSLFINIYVHGPDGDVDNYTSLQVRLSDFINQIY